MFQFIFHLLMHALVGFVLQPSIEYWMNTIITAAATTVACSAGTDRAYTLGQHSAFTKVIKS